MRAKLLMIPVVACLGLCLVLPAAPASAHELLPVELVDYLREHPNMTQAQLDEYLSSQTAMTNGDAAYKQRLMDTVFAGKVGFFENAATFMLLGIRHILEGYDHILFVLSLLLTFVTLRQMMKSITAFTLAHSITLILAGLNVVTLGSRLVESMIAFSIAFVAIGTVYFRRITFFSSLESKISMIFLFGLFHGLGFAGLLKTLSIPEGEFLPSLLFFNVGIEIGQLCIIAAALPFILCFRNKRWYPQAIKVLAAVIAAIALYWFAQRAFGIGG